MFYNISKRITFRLLPFTAMLYIKRIVTKCALKITALKVAARKNFAQRVAIERVVFSVLSAHTLTKETVDVAALRD